MVLTTNSKNAIPEKLLQHADNTGWIIQNLVGLLNEPSNKFCLKKIKLSYDFKEEKLVFYHKKTAKYNNQFLLFTLSNWNDTYVEKMAALAKGQDNLIYSELSDEYKTVIKKVASQLKTKIRKAIKQYYTLVITDMERYHQIDLYRLFQNNAFLISDIDLKQLGEVVAISEAHEGSNLPHQIITEAIFKEDYQNPTFRKAYLTQFMDWLDDQALTTVSRRNPEVMDDLLQVFDDPDYLNAKFNAGDGDEEGQLFMTKLVRVLSFAKHFTNDNKQAFFEKVFKLYFVDPRGFVRSTRKIIETIEDTDQEYLMANLMG